MKAKSLFFLFFGLLILFKGNAQQYNFSCYSVENGVAQSQVYAILQDSRGLLWLGTRGGGLTMYNGYEFLNYTEKDGLSDNYIYDLFEDEDHNLWVTTNDGLTKYDGKTFKTYKPEGINRNFQIQSTVSDEKGGFWMATSNGLYHFDGENFKALNVNLGNVTISSVAFLKDQLYIGTNLGLYNWSTKGQERLIYYGDSTRYMKNAISCLRLGKNDKLWIGTYGDGAYCYDQRMFYRIDLNLELYRTTVLEIFNDQQGNIWFGTLNNGIVHYETKTKKFDRLTEAEGLSNNHVRRIYQDQNDHFWIGTSGGGVCYYTGKQFTTFDESNGLSGRFIYSIFRDAGGKLWVANSTRGISFYNNGKFEPFLSETQLDYLKVKSITGVDSTLYVGTELAGVWIVEKDTVYQLEDLKYSNVKDLKIDQWKRLWVATLGNGIYIHSFIPMKGMDNGFLTTEEGLVSNRITSLFIEEGKRIWYGTEDEGLVCINSYGKKIFHFSRKNGLNSNIVRTLSLGPQNHLFVGTAGGGVNAINLKTPSVPLWSITLEKGLTSNNIYLLALDQEDQLIVGSEKGLDRLRVDENGQVLEVKHFGKNDGFSGVETCQSASFSDDDGSLWFGTVNGLVHFNPVHLKKNTRAPQLAFTDLKLAYRSIKETDYKNVLGAWNQVGDLTLSADDNQIGFEFLAVNLSAPNSVKYKWKLEGFDEQWSPESKEHSMVYSNLNPGKYSFLVKACNEDGVWTKDPIRVNFIILAPFYQQTWFIVSSILFIVLLIYLMVRWRFNVLRHKGERERSQLKMEKELVELEQKALRLQMNPHFIFNAMNSIQAQIGTGNDKEARYYLAKFSRLMRQILDHTRKITISLNEEIQTIENYLLIEKFCNDNRFEYTLDVPESLETELIEWPPMLLQPFIENAIKHGFKTYEGKDVKGKIEIVFEDLGDFVRCVIRDNGIGRNKSAELNAKSKETYHKSSAMDITQKRLELWEQGSTKARMVVSDIETNGQVMGTEVLIEIPTK